MVSPIINIRFDWYVFWYKLSFFLHHSLYTFVCSECEYIQRDKKRERIRIFVKLLLIRKNVICVEHSLHKITCHCHCAPSCRHPMADGAQGASAVAAEGGGMSSTRKENLKKGDRVVSEVSLAPSDASSVCSGCWTCVVCCNKVPGPARLDLFALGPCDHIVCYECSTKMRVLCEQNECPICRQDIPKVRLYNNQAFL